MANIKKNEREYVFDILKFIAISIIVLHHYQQVANVRFSHGINWSGGDFYWGNLVELFFMVSGYFTFNSIARVPGKGGLQAFFKKKYLRFLPMLLVCGVSCLVIQYFYSRYTNPEAPFDFTLWNIIASLFGVERWLDTGLMINNPMWYVSILLLCLLMFYLVTILAKRHPDGNLVLAYGMMVAFGLFMRYATQTWGVNAPFFNIFIARGFISFFMGLVIAVVFSEEGIIGNRIKSAPFQAFAFSVIVLFFALFLVNRPLIVGAGDTLYFTLCFVLYPAILAICKNPLLNKLLDHRALKNIGGIAFNMYMWHVPLLYLFLSFAPALSIPVYRRFVMYGFLAVCFVFAVLSFKLIDTPFARKTSELLNKQP